jgi:uncharacterized iron-regulated membrane protein
MLGFKAAFVLAVACLVGSLILFHCSISLIQVAAMPRTRSQKSQKLQSQLPILSHSSNGLPLHCIP